MRRMVLWVLCAELAACSRASGPSKAEVRADCAAMIDMLLEQKDAGVPCRRALEVVAQRAPLCPVHIMCPPEEGGTDGDR